MRVLTYVFFSLIACNFVAVQSCNSKKSKKGGGSTSPQQTPAPTPVATAQATTAVPPATATTPVGITGYTCTSSSGIPFFGSSSNKTIIIDPTGNRMQIQTTSGTLEYTLQPQKLILSPYSQRYVVSSATTPGKTGHLYLDTDGKTLIGQARTSGVIPGGLTGIPYVENGASKSLSAILKCHQ